MNILRQIILNLKGINMKSMLGRRLLTWFLLLSLIPLLLISAINYFYSYNTIYKDAESILLSVSQSKTKFIEYYFDRLFTDLEAEAENVHNAEFIENLDNAYKESGKSLADFVKSYNWFVLDDEYGNDLKTVQKTFGYYDIFLLNTEGDILFTVAHEKDFGTNLFTGKYSKTKFAKTCKETLQGGKAGFSDFELFEASHNIASIFITSLIVDEFGDKVGLIAYQVPLEQLTNIIQERSGMGETGEVYIIGADLKLRSDFYEDTISSVLKRTINTQLAKSWYKIHVTDGKIESDNKPEVYEGPNGDEVLGMYNNIVIKGVSLGIIAEIDKSEAFAMIGSLQLILLLVFIITAVIVVFIALVVSNQIAKPIRYISEIADRSADGEKIEITEGLDKKDEIGTLLRSFSKMNKSVSDMTLSAEKIANGDLTVTITPRSEKDLLGKALATMVKNMLAQFNEISTGVNTLSSATTEIMATVSQLSAGAAESATSISEASSTMGEIKQTAEVSNKKATQVSEAAQQISSISVDGTKTIEETREGMSKIKQQMESIADIVVRLSEQSQSIGSIAGSVNDLAEQSNLLAVNASIEAAKAGEHGKGFAVVAQEIKNLAERSKDSTSQIRTILVDIQKAISSAVMATEQGGKVADEGFQLSLSASEVINTLAASIEQAAQSNIQIAASSKQQLIGMDQITTAMESIRESSMQTAASTKQTEGSVSSIHELGEKLKQILNEYKLS